MLKFIENHPLITMFIMAVSTIVGFALSEIHYINKVEEEYEQSKNIKTQGGKLSDYRFDEKV